jgi:hypothetical protein
VAYGVARSLRGCFLLLLFLCFLLRQCLSLAATSNVHACSEIELSLCLQIASRALLCFRNTCVLALTHTLANDIFPSYTFFSPLPLTSTAFLQRPHTHLFALHRVCVLSLQLFPSSNPVPLCSLLFYCFVLLLDWCRNLSVFSYPFTHTFFHSRDVLLVPSRTAGEQKAVAQLYRGLAQEARHHSLLRLPRLPSAPPHVIPRRSHQRRRVRDGDEQRQCDGDGSWPLPVHAADTLRLS